MKSVKEESIVIQLAVVATMMPKVKEYIDQQADLIRNLQKSLGFKNSGYETINLTPQTKPLSDEEIREIGDDCVLKNNGILNWIDFARAIEERHGIK